MVDGYKGMRWIKCDLHMHTPVDSRNWLGKQLTQGQETDAASSFAEACYNAGLDVVGITDHNFISKDFLPLLYEAFKELEQKYSRQITIFPGFEFEAAGVGKGVHVLCLFNPGSDPGLIDNILTECGVGYPRVNNGVFEKSDKNLKKIIGIVQNKHKGLVILPHSLSDDGIFDSNRVSDWLQVDQFTNPDLLAVEVSKPVCQMSENFQKLFRNGSDCFPEWKRIRPIAPLMSSDCKQLLCSNDNEPVPNSVNYRYSWIKMSLPSIESLRQAFLDHESRIMLPHNVLADICSSNHPFIKSITVKNVQFLANQEVYLSPNMNCIIGGRGSGKSTLLEYVRFLMQKDDDNLDEGTIERIERVKSTIPSHAELELCFQGLDGMEDHIKLHDGESCVTNRDLLDSETYFKSLPIQFYSQQQLNRLTESKTKDGRVRQAQRLLELIDGFAGNNIATLEDKERRLTLKIKDSFNIANKIRAFDKEIKKLKQEYQGLERLWRARLEIQQDVDIYQMYKSESEYFENIMGEPGNQFSDVISFAESVANSHVHYSVKNSPHEKWFSEFDRLIKSAKNCLVITIRSAVEQFAKEIEKILANDPEWVMIKNELDEADSVFKEACATKGLSPDDVEQLQDIKVECDKKKEEIKQVEVEVAKLKENVNNSDDLLEELHQVWKSQFEMRLDASESANELAKVEDGTQQFIAVSVKYQQDYAHFFELWQGFAPPDRRTRLGRNWDQIGDILYKCFAEQDNADSPWQVLMHYLNQENTTEHVLKEYENELTSYIAENHELWEQLRCSRVRDIVDMKLFRADGTNAGSIAEGALSDGQRNTAALVLLLAQEGGPLIIDQPEDELDSSFIYSELMPMLRKVKSKRQLIFATHNANLPVNGDAELVYAFEARNGQGKVLAQGGLDLDDVTNAILDIMEGSREAFRRRREKYNF